VCTEDRLGVSKFTATSIDASESPTDEPWLLAFRCRRKPCRSVVKVQGRISLRHLAHGKPAEYSSAVILHLAFLFRQLMQANRILSLCCSRRIRVIRLTLIGPMVLWVRVSVRLVPPYCPRVAPAVIHFELQFAKECQMRKSTDTCTVYAGTRSLRSSGNSPGDVRTCGVECGDSSGNLRILYSTDSPTTCGSPPI